MEIARVCYGLYLTDEEAEEIYTALKIEKGELSLSNKVELKPIGDDESFGWILYHKECVFASLNYLHCMILPKNMKVTVAEMNDIREILFLTRISKSPDIILTSIHE